MMPAAIPSFAPLDPLLVEKTQSPRSTANVIQALNAKNYKGKWSYAMGNPGEVVPEVLTAIQHGRTVPKGLAAVYVAYGGQRSPSVDAALQQSFGGRSP
jgi:hypothetical protein